MKKIIPWTSLLIVLLIILFSSIIASLLDDYNDHSEAGRIFADNISWHTIFGIIQVILLGIGFLIYSIISKRKWGEIKLFYKSSFRLNAIDVLLGIILSIPLYFIVLEIGHLLYHAGIASEYLDYELFSHGFLPLFKSIYIIVLIEVVFIELFYRGFVFHFFHSYYGLIASVMLTSVILSLTHWEMGISYMIIKFIISLILTFFYVWRNNIIAPITLSVFYSIVIFIAVPLKFKTVL